MNLPTAHIDRLQELGYTESEARFLYIVVVFSGYFTLGQFRSSTDCRCGKRPSSFAQKLIGQGHARVCAQARTAALFHLFSRTVYGQMDKDNLRNRKRHSFEFMRTRVVLLDFILANQGFAYFETEADKVNFFCNEMGISRNFLPARVYEGAAPDRQTVRYFVDKFPLFLAPPLPGVPPVVTFSYVDSGFERPTSFASHLATYQPLFRQANSFRFLYIATKEAYFRGAEERFRSMVKRPLEADVSNEILRYFQIRRRWENHEYVIPVTEDLEFLRDARERFQGEKIESLYSSWRSETIAKCQLRAEICKLKPERAVFFDTYLVGSHRSSDAEENGLGDSCMKDIHLAGELKTRESAQPLPLTRQACEILREWKNEQGQKSPFLFPSPRDSNKPIGSVRKAWRATLKRAGVSYFPIYNLRHVFCTRLSWIAPDAVVQRAMRHSSPETKRVYQLGLVHQVREHMERANEKAYQGREPLHLRDSASAEESTEQKKKVVAQ